MAIADIHEDIIKTNILTRLDGQTLAAAGCASSQLQSLCSDHKLWSDICSSNWPSTNDPLVTKTISNFPSTHRSFYSDVFPSPADSLISVTSLSQTTQIISSVDLKYNDKLIFSKVESTNTTPTSDWFQTSPFRIDLLKPKELISSTMKLFNDQDILLSNLENQMTLSWIMIDPTQKRAVNLSSTKPVSVQRNWLTTDIELTFAIVIKHDNKYINCNILVTLTRGLKQGGEEVNVSGVSLTILDMDGKCLSGKDSMAILQGLITAAKRQCNGGEGRIRARYDEYIQRRRERNEKTEKRERRLDMACVASGVALVMAFWSFAIC